LNLECESEIRKAKQNLLKEFQILDVFEETCHWSEGERKRMLDIMVKLIIWQMGDHG